MKQTTTEAQALEELTLLVLYLSSWEEKVAGDLSMRHAWKGHVFEVLDTLAEKGLIEQKHGNKSLMFTNEGEKQARALIAKYLGK